MEKGAKQSLLASFLDLPAIALEITPGRIRSLSSTLKIPSIEASFEGDMAQGLQSTIRKYGLQDCVVDLVLCGPQTQVRFAAAAPAGADIIAWAEQLVKKWLPKGLEPEQAVWVMDTIHAGPESFRHYMLSLFRKSLLQGISAVLDQTQCVLRSVHGGAYPLLAQIRPTMDDYAILGVENRITRVLAIVQGAPAAYYEIPENLKQSVFAQSNDNPGRLVCLEKCTSLYRQIHQQKEPIRTFVVARDGVLGFTELLQRRGYAVLPCLAAGEGPKTEIPDNLPPEIGTSHQVAYTGLLRSRSRFVAGFKKSALGVIACCLLLGLFEAGIRVEKAVNTQKYKADDVVLASYVANRQRLAHLQARYGELFAAVSKRGDVPAYLDAVAQALPERVWLCELSYHIDRNGKRLDIVGFTEDATQIAPFLNGIQQNKSVSGVEQRFIEVIGKDRVAQMTRQGKGARELTKFKAEVMLR